MATEATLRKNVATWLNQYKGITEGSTEHKAILAVFNDSKLCTRYTMTVNDAWCATAASAAFIATGLSSIAPFVECSCSKMITLAKSAGIWVEDDSYTPSIGDLMLYDWDDTTGSTSDNTGNPDHVGIVQAISGTTITVIEGNKSNTVGTRSMQVNGKYIRGYITPNFASVADSSSGSSTSTSTTPDYSGTGVGTAVALTAMRIRDAASTSTGNILSTITKGTAVEVLEVLSNGWYKIVWAGASCGYAYTSNSNGKYYTYTANSTSGSTTASADTSFAVGDKVTVTGTIYGNGNGSGGSIQKSKATMYVVNLVDSSKYTYYIGLAAKKGGTRQGWAKPSILTKA